MLIIFLSTLEQTNPDEAKDIRTIINGGKVDIAKAIYGKAVASKEINEMLISDTLKGLEAFPKAYKLYKMHFQISTVEMMKNTF